MIKSKVKKEKKNYAIIGIFDFLDMCANNLDKQMFFYNTETPITSEYYTLMFKRNSPLFHYYNRFIQYARDFGFLHKWQNEKYHWQENLNEIKFFLNKLPNNKIIDSKTNNIFGTINTEQFLHIYVIYIYSLAIGNIVFVLEIISKMFNIQQLIKFFNSNW